ncbi:hypothetical protein RBSWK_03514 [Rhodopirellula baltica SWK14]|uniref:Uncharacterized protein n=1 Tax=Rhodopirellula baltica SWK14 TaxID=993516 RepID=L7CEZ2_RHOBT|nr:hypothetical protein RBSWK_03514 [Rhodopirellula baltica SWK14]
MTIRSVGHAKILSESDLERKKNASPDQPTNRNTPFAVLQPPPVLQFTHRNIDFVVEFIL